MLSYKQSLPDDEESISLLTTLLIRYPEVCSINYSPVGRQLRLSFILKSQLDKKSQEQFQEELQSCVSTYIYFEKKEEPKHFKVKYSDGPGIGIVEITRDAATLTQKEIALIINYMQDRFPGILVSDELALPEDDLLEQDDFIRYMLDKLRIKYPKYKLIAVREEGRVLVFKR